MRFNNVIHDPVRLRIMVALVCNDKADFTHLKEVTSATDGNLSSHLATLEKYGFIEVEKTFLERKPKTYYRITQEGAQILNGHLDYLEGIIRIFKN